MTPVAAVVLVIAAWVVLAAVMAWGLMRLDRADDRRIDPRHPAAVQWTDEALDPKYTVSEAVGILLDEAQARDELVEWTLPPVGFDEWPATAQDRLIRDIIESDGMSGPAWMVQPWQWPLLRGLTPLTPDLIPAESEWDDQLARLFDASGLPEAES